MEEGLVNMNEEEKLRLKRKYKEMSEKELLELLSVDEKEFEQDIYQLLLDEAKRRGIEAKIDENKRQIKKSEIDAEARKVHYVSTNKRFLNLILDSMILYLPIFILLAILEVRGVITEEFLDTFENSPGGILLLTFCYYFIFESFKYEL
jgi:hypothetical protein